METSQPLTQFLPDKIPEIEKNNMCTVSAYLWNDFNLLISNPGILRYNIIMCVLSLYCWFLVKILGTDTSPFIVNNALNQLPYRVCRNMETFSRPLIRYTIKLHSSFTCSEYKNNARK
jgi:hypothetical protein